MDFQDPPQQGGVAGGILIADMDDPPRLTLQYNGSVLELSWTGEGYTLLEADKLDGAGSPAPDQSNPQTVETTEDRKFFQLDR